MTQKQFEKEANKKWIQIFTAVAQGFEFGNTKAFNILSRDEQGELIASLSGELTHVFSCEDAVNDLIDQIIPKPPIKPKKPKGPIKGKKNAEVISLN